MKVVRRIDNLPSSCPSATRRTSPSTCTSPTAPAATTPSAAILRQSPISLLCAINSSASAKKSTVFQELSESAVFKAKTGGLSAGDLLLLLSPSVAMSANIGAGGGGPYSCRECSSKFPSLHALDFHHQTYHAKGKEEKEKKEENKSASQQSQPPHQYASTPGASIPGCGSERNLSDCKRSVVEHVEVTGTSASVAPRTVFSPEALGSRRRGSKRSRAESDSPTSSGGDIKRPAAAHGIATVTSSVKTAICANGLHGAPGSLQSSAVNEVLRLPAKALTNSQTAEAPKLKPAVPAVTPAAAPRRFSLPSPLDVKRDGAVQTESHQRLVDAAAALTSFDHMNLIASSLTELTGAGGASSGPVSPTSGPLTPTNAPPATPLARLAASAVESSGSGREDAQMLKVVALVMQEQQKRVMQHSNGLQQQKLLQAPASLVHFPQQQHLRGQRQAENQQQKAQSYRQEQQLLEHEQQLISRWKALAATAAAAASGGGCGTTTARPSDSLSQNHPPAPSSTNRVLPTQLLHRQVQGAALDTLAQALEQSALDGPIRRLVTAGSSSNRMENLSGALAGVPVTSIAPPSRQGGSKMRPVVVAGDGAADRAATPTNLSALVVALVTRLGHQKASVASVAVDAAQCMSSCALQAEKEELDLELHL